MRTPEEIVMLFRTLKQQRAPWVNKAREVRKMYDGEMAVPLPELDKNEKPAAVNLLGPGLDQMAMRVASVLPDESWPALRDGFKGSLDTARLRRKASLAWKDMNDMKLIMRLRARHLLGYGTSAVTLSPISSSPFDKREIPHWRVRDPLETYCAPCENQLDFEPLYGIVCHHQTLAWLKLKYPDQYNQLRKGKFKDDPTSPVPILEYHDHEQITLIALGSDEPTPLPRIWTPDGRGAGVQDGSQPFVLLSEPLINRAEIPLIVCPGRIVLGDPHGLFDGMIGKYMRAAKLDALETIAVQRSIFADEWIVSHPNAPGTAKIVRPADGKTGVRGIISNGVIMTIQPQPGIQTPQAIDRIERTERIESGIPAEFGGESPTNVRTARRGESVLSATVDMPVQEAQEILEISLEAENRRAVAIQKAYYGSKTFSFYVGRDGKNLPKADTYVPNDIFETDVHFVKYSMPGADMSGLIIGMGQRVGLGTFSTESFMEMDPLVEDVELERSRISKDGMRKAFLAFIEQGAASGQIDGNVLARILTEMQDPTVLPEEAWTKVHNQMQQEQQEQAEAAQAGQPPGPEAQPGANVPPGASPPGAAPGAGPTPGMPVGPANPSSQNLAAILGSLRAPTNQSPAEQAA